MILNFILAKLALIPAISPVMAVIWMVVGILHTAVKPTFDLLHLIFKKLPWAKPEQDLEEVERSGFMKGFLYILDRLSGLGPKG